MIPYRLAKLYYQEKLVEEAIFFYEETLKLIPKNVDIHLEIAYVYLAEKQPEKAVSLLRKAQELPAKRFHQAHINLLLGLAFIDLKNNEEAVKSFLRTITLDKKNDLARYYLGTLYEDMGRKEEAEIEFKKAIELNPKNADACNYLGYMWAEEGKNLDEAINLIRKALEAEPDNGAYIDSLGWAYYKKNLPKEACKHLKRAAELLPKDPVILEHLGDAYLKNGQVKEALSAWKKSLTRNPANKSLKEKIKRYEK